MELVLTFVHVLSLCDPFFDQTHLVLRTILFYFTNTHTPYFLVYDRGNEPKRTGHWFHAILTSSVCNQNGNRDAIQKAWGAMVRTQKEEYTDCFTYGSLTVVVLNCLRGTPAYASRNNENIDDNNTVFSASL